MWGILGFSGDPGAMARSPNLLTEPDPPCMAYNTARTGRVKVEKDTPEVQVPIYKIELAIARWKEEEQTS